MIMLVNRVHSLWNSRVHGRRLHENGYPMSYTSSGSLGILKSYARGLDRRLLSLRSRQADSYYPPHRLESVAYSRRDVP